jgi:MinD superfamily P-loop ATPase
MKEILFISGKGGTGKTSLTSSFIDLADGCIACDYDVDASNLPILLKPKNTVGHDFSAGNSACIDEDICTGCGLCTEICRFDAINDDYQVVPLSCEGCGFCTRICPMEAIRMEPRSSGHWFSSEFKPSQSLFFADLRPGEENSGKLVAQVKSMARQQALSENTDLIIADGPPGIGCAVISSMVETDMIILVAEPGLSGFHDLQRIYELIKLRGIKAVLIINKWDLNPEISQKIENWANEQGIYLIGKMPFSTTIAGCIAEAKIPSTNSQIRNLLFPIWENILQQLYTL